MDAFRKKLEAHKRDSTLQLLFKCARVLNEQALATLPVAEGSLRPRPSHMALFPHIDLDEGTRQRELAERLGVSKQAVTQLVDDLEAMGVVQRLPDPDDGRAKRVHFTAAGRRSMLDGLRHLGRIERELSQALGETTLRSLHRALLRLHDHLAPEAPSKLR